MTTTMMILQLVHRLVLLRQERLRIKRNTTTARLRSLLTEALSQALAIQVLHRVLALHLQTMLLLFSLPRPQLLVV
jgi:hypothetical protein